MQSHAALICTVITCNTIGHIEHAYSTITVLNYVCDLALKTRQLYAFFTWAVMIIKEKCSTKLSNWAWLCLNAHVIHTCSVHVYYYAFICSTTMYYEQKVVPYLFQFLLLICTFCIQLYHKLIPRTTNKVWGNMHTCKWKVSKSQINVNVFQYLIP